MARTTKKEIPNKELYEVRAGDLFTPVILCDKNCNIIYKNKVAHMMKFGNEGSMLLDPSDKDSVEKVKRVLDGVSKCEFITISGSLYTRQAIVCRRYLKPDETVWIFTSIGGGLLRLDNAEKLARFAPGIVSHICYNEAPIKQYAYNKNDKYELFKMISFSEAVNISSMKTQSAVSISDACEIVNGFLLEIFDKSASPFKLYEDHPMSTSSYIQYPEIFISTALVILSSIIMSTLPHPVDIRIWRFRGYTVFDIFGKLPVKYGERYTELFDLIEIMPEFAFEFKIADMLSDHYGWKITVEPYIAPNINSRIRISLASKPAGALKSQNVLLSAAPKEEFAKYLSAYLMLMADSDHKPQDV